MSGGQQINSGQGAVNVLGDETEGTMVGSSSTASPGDFGKSVFARLRSRKIQESSSSKALTGSSFSGVQGAFGKQRTRAMSGSAVVSSRGNVIYVPGTPAPAGLLVDEVAFDAALKNHEDVIWYDQPASKNTVVGSGRDQWWSNSGFTDPGYIGPGAEMVSVSEYGIDYAIRWASPYTPDHYVTGSDGSGNATYGTSGDGLTIQSMRKYISQTTKEPSGTTALLSSGVLTEGYLRWMIYVDPDVASGMTETHMKLSGFNGRADGLGVQNLGATLGYFKPLAGSGQVQLSRYNWTSISHGFEEGHIPFSPARYLTLGQWHSLEIHLKANSTVSSSDGEARVWLDDILIFQRTGIQFYNSIPAGWPHPAEINNVRGQLFHGGQTAVPTAPIHHTQWGWCLANRRIGKAKAMTLTQDLNSGSWVSTWPDNFPGPAGSGTSMEYSNCYLDPQTNRDLEFSLAGHSRGAGSNVGVRWADFTLTGAPTGGYYWNNLDSNISETDNAPTLFLPWNRWCWLVTQKIIDIDGPTAIFRNNDGSGADFWVDFHDLILGSGVGAGQYSSNYNPASIVNPGASDAFEIYFGGGYFGNGRLGFGPTMKLVKPNPNYPATSSKPLTLKVWFYTQDAPILQRSAVRIGNYAYWGGAMQDAGTFNDRSNRFYRIDLTTLEASYNTNAIPQVRMADIPLNMAYSARFSLLCADTVRGAIILINGQGVFRYTIATDTWQGPFTFGLGSAWGTTFSEGLYNPLSGDWHGFVGVHRSDLNCTFFRYSLSKEWNRINWGG
jgi:hypothetical protein